MKRHLPLAAAVWLAAALPAGGAVFKYLAFGDSITQGVHDTGEVGYPAKLESLLDGAGRPSDVVKRGVGGEVTAAGLTRLDSVLAEGGQVLLLQEGTNDVFNRFISVETAAANLAAMADKATAAGIDTVHVTLIPTKKQCANEPNAKNPEASQLADLVAQSAVDNGFWLVDLFDIWSAIGNLYATYYYQGCDDGVGHPRNAGYWLMAQEIFDELTGTPLPGTPAPTGPSGDTTAAAPAFTWNEATNATWYELWIKDAAGATVHRAWHKASDHCASPCTVTPDPLPGGGDYSWTVQGRNPGGLGPVSTQLVFTYWDAPPAAAAPTSPAGPIFATDPAFSWPSVTKATSYRLEVENSAGTLHDVTYAGATICAADSCSVAPTLGLTPDSYAWRLTTSNPAGSGPVSSDLDFEVRTCTAGDMTVGPGSSSDSELYEFCGTITITGFTVNTGDDATFHAGAAVVIENDTSFADGSTVSIIIG